MTFARLAATIGIATAVFSQPAFAHFIFIELPPESPGMVHMRFSDEPLEATNRRFQRLIEHTIVHTACDHTVEMGFGEEALEGAVPADTPSVAGSLLYGVLDRSEQGRGIFLLQYHAKGVRALCGAESRVGLPLEIVAEQRGNRLIFTVLHNGEPAPGAEVWALAPGHFEPLTLETNAAGQAEVPFDRRGWLGIRAMVAEDIAGEHEGEAYELTRHYTTLTLYHDLEKGTEVR